MLESIINKSCITHALVAYIISVPLARIFMLEMERMTPFAVLCILFACLLNYLNPLQEALAYIIPPFRYASFRAAVTLVIAIACYLKEIRGPRPPLRNLTGKVYLVTGANSGIGLETTRQLAEMGATVIMGCRSPTRAQAALDDVNKSLPKNCRGKAVVLTESLDLSSLSRVQAFATELKQQYRELHGIVLNAGMIPGNTYTLTEEGVENTFASNHLGHFFLVSLLLSHIARVATADDPARIVVLSSSLHKIAKSNDACKPPAETNYASFPAYAQTKLANLLYMNALIRRIAQSTEFAGKITVNAVHPGNPFTSVTGNMPKVLQVLESVFKPFLYLYRETCTAGAFTSVFAVTSSSISGMNGLYLVDSKDAFRSPEANHVVNSEKLWVNSETIIRDVFSKNNVTVSE